LLEQVNAHVGLNESNPAEARRTPCGPNRVPVLLVVPQSSGAPTNATSYSPTLLTSSQYGAFRNVLMPAKYGSNPRTNSEMPRSLTDGAA
jgi:hypothetical protein